MKRSFTNSLSLPSYFKLSATPVADSNAQVCVGPARFTVLTSRILRLEYQEDGLFTDQASQLFWYRLQPVPTYDVRCEDEYTVVETEYLHLRYANGQRFAADTLTITLKHGGTVWRYGDKDKTNLLGTTRTLDQVSGSTKLEPGLLSRAGWAVVDDSASLLFTDEGWLEPRRNHCEDLYFLGYGQEYQACLTDYCRVAGSIPLLPRWALGNWWSRYWAYTQDELAGVVREFQEHQVPLAVCIIDMDWHLTDVPTSGHIKSSSSPGWTGYTWNQELFPDPDAFITWLHEQGLKTALNLHPADGVRPHEAMYAEMARRLGVDPETRQPIEFDIANPAFATAYFEVLHHPEEARGVDFWWMDWQQEKTTTLPGLDPLWWLNHLHAHDLARGNMKRPFVFSRWGGLGNHRYPIGFSGDTHVDWESLTFQPFFTSTAANVGYGWWSHDIGGHGSGIEEGELYARWVQFGLFSPILRLHSSKNPFSERRPWGYDSEVERAASKALRLRHSFIPYLYSMAWLNHKRAVAPVRPMYHEYPEPPAAYQCPQQFMFGTELIAAPFVSRAHPETRLARQRIWLPEGEWYDFFTGEGYSGGRQLTVHGRLHDIPVFARAGAIVPLGPEVGWGGIESPSELHIHIFAGQDGRFTLYEDDGETMGYLNGQFAQTEIAHAWQDSKWQLTIHACTGNSDYAPERRDITLHCHGICEPKQISLDVGQELVVPTSRYDPLAEVLVVYDIEVARSETLLLTLTAGDQSLLSRRDRVEEKAFAYLRSFHLQALTKRSIAREWSRIRQEPVLLEGFTPLLTENQRRALLDLIGSYC